MPYYDFECEKCGSIFELTDPEANIKCPKCKTKLLRKFGFAGIKFRGEGFNRSSRS